MNSLLKTSLWAIALFLGGGLGSVSALTISPAKIEITGDPGTTLHGEIKLYNEQTGARTFFASYENFEPIGEAGTPYFVGGTEGLATWIDTERSITIASGETQTIPFTITIPTDATPGGHFGAIFWGTQNPENRGGGEVSVGAKLGALVLLRVSGAIEENAGILDFETKDKQRFFSSLPVAFTYRVNNAGGDRIVPRGDIQIKNSVRFTTSNLTANKTEGNVLPGSARRFETVWESKGEHTEGGFWNGVVREVRDFRLGWYTATLDLSWGGAPNQRDTSTYHFFIFPWHLLTIVFLGGGVLLFLGGRGLKSYNKRIIGRALAQQQKQ